ncbi:MAG: hypothetical protein PF489_13665 [Salinivirgaceae bacterium]|jgi:hypothetical protein|nr:hypothetical protein [Salinivirgaceae bacterium]
MFKNDKLIKALNKEQKFARQFVIAAVLVVAINGNALIFIMQKIDSLPKAYWIQLGIIPLLLAMMIFYYFRIHKKNMKNIRDNFEREMLSENDDK